MVSHRGGDAAIGHRTEEVTEHEIELSEQALDAPDHAAVIVTAAHRHQKNVTPDK